MRIRSAERGSIMPLLKGLPQDTGFPELDAAIGKVKRLIEQQRLVGVRIDTLNEQKKGAANADKRKHAEALAAGKKPPTTKESNVAKVDAEIAASQAEFEAYADAIGIAEHELGSVVSNNAVAWITDLESSIDASWAEYLAQLEKVEAAVIVVGKQRAMTRFIRDASKGQASNKSLVVPQVVHSLSDDRQTTTWDQLFARLRAESEWRSPPTPELSTGKLVAQRATKRGLEEVEIEPDRVRSGGSSLYTTADR
jgi:hypothetical protein